VFSFVFRSQKFLSEVLDYVKKAHLRLNALSGKFLLPCTLILFFVGLFDNFALRTMLCASVGEGLHFCYLTSVSLVDDIFLACSV